MRKPSPAAGVSRLRYSASAGHKYVPRRAVLYVPGNDEKKIKKIPSLKVDCAVLDCEDGVAVNKKSEVRQRIVKTLEDFDLGPTEKCVRVNSVSSGLAEEDLMALLESRVLPSSLMLPKVEGPEEIQWFSDKFLLHLKGRKLEQPMNLIPFVETAMGLLNFKAVCEETLKTGPPVGLFLDGVVFGGEDFRASIGATSSKDAQDILYARQKIVTVAKAFGLQAVDLVYIDFRDEAGLLRQAREGAAMGFTGRLAPVVSYKAEPELGAFRRDSSGTHKGRCLLPSEVSCSRSTICALKKPCLSLALLLEKQSPRFISSLNWGPCLPCPCMCWLAVLADFRQGARLLPKCFRANAQRTWGDRWKKNVPKYSKVISKTKCGDISFSSPELVFFFLLALPAPPSSPPPHECLCTWGHL
uniref:Citramalyl-CoA lyase, mitochondrial n=1 Tax=Oryctolagus cuniculus TaxID=9986 RepID=A0A5F9CZ56_RABIT